MKHEVKIGQTDYTVLILARNSTTGVPVTGLTFASAGIDVCYTRVETDNDVVLTAGAPVTTTLTGVHVDWGFVEVDATNAPGLYKLDIADGVFATGAWSAVVSLICTGVDPIHIEFILVPEAPYTGVVLASSVAAAINAIADGLLDRNMATGTDSGTATIRTARQALRLLRNKWTVAAGALSVKKEDDSTESWAATLTSDAAAQPITSCDPASA